MANKNNKSNGKRTPGRDNRRGNGGRARDSRDESEVRNKKGNKYREDDNRGRTEAANDTTWYGGNSLLMQDAAKVSFQTAAGVAAKIVPYSEIGIDTTASTSQFAFPGIMTFDVMFGPGYADGWSAPMNVAARKIYTFVRHVNSGHSNYDAANLMQYILLMDNAYAFYANMVRAYGLINLTMARNRYVPKDLMTAARLNYEDLMKNMASFKYYINSYAARLNTMAVPDVPLFKRHMWLFSNVYADCPTDKSQFYIFIPSNFWAHEFNMDTKVNYLKPVANSGSISTYAEFVTAGESILNELLNVEDWNIMSGDIMKAYGDRLFKINPIADDYMTIPTFEPEVLMQIHNIRVMTVAGYGAGPDGIFESDNFHIQEVVTEDTNGNSGYLKWTPRFKCDDTLKAPLAIASPSVVDVPVENPDPSILAAATRLNVIGTITALSTDKTYAYMSPKCMGCELVLAAHVYTRGISRLTEERAYTGDRRNRPLGIEVFEQRPLEYCAQDFLVLDGQPNFTVLAPDGDITNWAVVSANTMKNIHEAAMLALFGVATM